MKLIRTDYPFELKIDNSLLDVKLVAFNYGYFFGHGIRLAVLIIYWFGIKIAKEIVLTKSETNGID